ncbi:MAG: glycosyltransferase family 4 protein [Candidatus Omnitrophica bacterium]|nr:glycosyltransferase family 4 protein [Candidatus Omnitrophota bacterium]
MKIGLDIRSTLKKRTGIGQYTLNLINHLAKIDQQNEYFLYSKRKLFDRKRRLPKLPGRNFRHKLDYFAKGPERTIGNIDIFHTSSFDLIKPEDSKLVLTIHDVIIKSYPQGHTKETIENVDKQLKDILKQVDVIIVDSYNTKDDLLKWYDVDDVIVKVVYPGVNDWFYPQACPDGKYLLFVGTIEPRKNISGLVKAFGKLKKEQKIEHKLIIVGMRGWMYNDVLNEIVISEFKDDIILKDYISNENLRSWYNQATAFIFPSFYEGFGFPIVEAFACGVPVVTSGTSSCGEVAGDAALLIDPNKPTEIADATMRIIKDSELAKDLRKKGIEQSKKFTWDKTATDILGIFDKVHRK